MKSSFLSLALLALLSTPFQAEALMFNQPLDFVAPEQNMWGTGEGSIGFDYNDSTTVSFPFGLGSFSIGYAVGASSGSVWGSFNGNITADYTPLLSSPGTTYIDLSYQGDPNGGSLNSTVGAHAELTSSVGNVGPNFQLNVNKNYTPELDQPVSGSNSLDNVVQLPLIDLLAAEAGVSMGVSQTNSFMATGIDGNLFYSLQGSGSVSSIPFMLDTNAGLGLPVVLTDPGIWDFWFDDQMLNNMFSTSLDLDLGAYAWTLVGCGDFGLGECEADWNVASPTVYDGSPFSLAFNSITNTNGFSIHVVPEPISSILFVTGGATLGFRRFRKKFNK